MNWKWIALLGIAAAAMATAFLVGRGSAGSSSHGETSTTSTSAGNVISVSTATTEPVATTTTSSPRISPPPTPAPRAVPSIPQISLELNRTVEIANGTTHFSANADPVTVSDGAGGWLTGIIGVRFPTADGYGQLVFFWHNTTFIGLDSHTESNQIIGVSAGPGHARRALHALRPHRRAVLSLVGARDDRLSLERARADTQWVAPRAPSR